MRRLTADFRPGDRFSYVARWSRQDQAARFEPVTETG
jgi:hypothetical protein